VLTSDLTPSAPCALSDLRLSRHKGVACGIGVCNALAGIGVQIRAGVPAGRPIQLNPSRTRPLSQSARPRIPVPRWCSLPSRKWGIPMAATTALAVVQEAWVKWVAADLDGFVKSFEPDGVWTNAGNNRVSGPRRGHAEIHRSGSADF
jgi:hypothetical protein